MAFRHVEMFVATRLSWIQLKMILVQRAAMEMAKRHEAMDATGVDGQFAAWMAAECVRDLLVQVDHHRLWVRIDLRQCKLELKISHALINLPAFGLGGRHRRRWSCDHRCFITMAALLRRIR